MKNDVTFYNKLGKKNRTKYETNKQTKRTTKSINK